MTTDVGVWSIQDIAILFNIIIIFLMFFNTFVFQAGLVNLLFHKFKGTIILTAVYFALSISLHVWVMNLRWKNSNSFIWTDGLQTLFVFQRVAAVLYCYFYKRTAVRLGDPRFYQDSLWLRKEFMQVRRICLLQTSLDLLTQPWQRMRRTSPSMQLRFKPVLVLCLLDF
ncbi:transmembrane protein 138 isoform X4 [Cebus imitator]|uniref:transmembrane protein 138 isoform X4 n=1 Tax=Cebus imitator TaxID=2715852 RepID=UPI001898678A|nr:transmembrane protein 138 isoform X4 [Cebus imitator]